MLLRIVVLLTLVYPSAAFIDQFAENHRPQKRRAREAVCLTVRGGSVEMSEMGLLTLGPAPGGRGREMERECERAR